MRNILLVAQREYLEQVRKRAFLLSTILVPAFMGAIVFMSVWSGKNLNSSKHLVLASNDAVLASQVKDQLLSEKNNKSSFDVVAPARAEDRAALVERVNSKDLDGFLWLESAPGKALKATYESPSSGDIGTAERLDSALNHVLVRQRLSARGIDAGQADALLKDVNVETVQVNKEGKETKSSFLTTFFKGYLMAILLMMTTMMYGMNVARSIIQEKTSRIYEVILAIAKPADVLAGKLIGAGAVGLTQIGIWVAAAGFAVSGGVLSAQMNGQLNLHLTWVEAVMFPAYFVLGYLLNAALFAGLAATCETEQELQMYAPVTTVPVALSFVLLVPVMSNPNSVLSIAASLFPLTAPVIMMFRMGSAMPPAWQFAASIALMLVTIWAVMKFSSKLYRVGILMYGKRATLPEMLRWLRSS
ncbi:MAG: ABC transporter permease [Terracidiphilus sp.]|nr:ABC transporter permease [Terracidiphilus sp.]